MLDRQVSHVVHLVDDLLHVSRITRGKVALKCEKLPLTDVLADASDASRPLIEAHGHHLELNVRRRESVFCRRCTSVMRARKGVWHWSFVGPNAE
jgi:signal transduction histidine kinase